MEVRFYLFSIVTTVVLNVENFIIVNTYLTLFVGKLIL